MLRRCDERVYIFSCSIYIGLDKIYYVQPGIAIFYVTTVLGFITCVADNGHACGVSAGMSNIRRQHAKSLGAGAPSLISFHITIAMAG
jgi:hypothetical protein